MSIMSIFPPSADPDKAPHDGHRRLSLYHLGYLAPPHPEQAPGRIPPPVDSLLEDPRHDPCDSREHAPPERIRQEGVLSGLSNFPSFLLYMYSFKPLWRLKMETEMEMVHGFRVVAGRSGFCIIDMCHVSRFLVCFFSVYLLGLERRSAKPRGRNPVFIPTLALYSCFWIWILFVM